MTKDEWTKYHKDLTDRMRKIAAAKNADYTGIDPDPFANFTIVERAGITDTETGFLTRMSDKLARINTFCKKGVLEVSDESIEDTLMDLANYCLLFAGYIKSKKD